MNLFKKMKRIWNLEENLTHALQINLDKASKEMTDIINEMKSSIMSCYNFTNKNKAEMCERLSRIEVLFAEELEAKEKERNLKITSLRQETIN